MSRLFIELYLDEDVSVLVADLLRARGFVALTTLEANQLAWMIESSLTQIGAGQKFWGELRERTI